MSSAIEVNGVTLIPGKEAAKKAGYSSDYIARLAREQKIIGTQIDRQWFIDRDSLEHFLQSAKIEKEARKKKLQEERTQERLLREERERVSNHHESQVTSTRLQTLVTSGVATFLVAMVGISAINLYHNISEVQSQGVQNTAQVKRSLVVVATDEPVINILPDITEEFLTDTVTPEFREASAVASTTFGEGVLVLTPGTSSTSVESIQDLFSDPVTVELTDDQTGKILVGPDGEETVYPVVIVPGVD